jgi:hypothetical protein
MLRILAKSAYLAEFDRQNRLCRIADRICGFQIFVCRIADRICGSQFFAGYRTGLNPAKTLSCKNPVILYRILRGSCPAPLSSVNRGENVRKRQLVL